MSANDSNDDSDPYAAPYREPRPCPDTVWNVRRVQEAKYAEVLPDKDVKGIDGDAKVFVNDDGDGGVTEWIAIGSDWVTKLEDQA